MPTTTAISPQGDAEAATSELLSGLKERVDRADVVCFFSTGHRVADVARFGLALEDAFPGAAVLGATGMGVLRDAMEYDAGGPALVALAGDFGGAAFRTIRIPAGAMGEGGLAPERWPIEASAEGGALLAVADPFSFPVPAFLEGMARAHPALPIVGGLASEGRQPGQNGLFCAGEIHGEGLVGLQVPPELRPRTLVSQGCRPVGKHWVITESKGPVIHKLGGRRALEVLQEVAAELDPPTRAAFQRGVFVGRAIDEYKSRYGVGDFLVQGLLGIDQQTGALVIGSEARRGTTVHFHVRDAASADEELRGMWAEEVAAAGRPDGALLFTCNGRGRRMWPEGDHDAACVQETCGPLPLAGFFAAGEIGPVGGRGFLHGFTASALLLGGDRSDA